MTETSTLVGHVTDAEHQPDLEGNMFPVDTERDVAALEVTGQRLEFGRRQPQARDHRDSLAPATLRFAADAHRDRLA